MSRIYWSCTWNIYPSFALTPTLLIAVVFTITLWDQKRIQLSVFWKPNILLPSLFHNEVQHCTHTAYSRYCCKEAAQTLRILERQLVHTPTNIIILTILTMLFKGGRHERGERALLEKLTGNYHPHPTYTHITTTITIIGSKKPYSSWEIINSLSTGIKV